jgi:uncharacterized protein (TIGR03118 family)
MQAKTSSHVSAASPGFRSTLRRDLDAAGRGRALVVAEQAFGPSGAAWVASNGRGLAPAYDGAGNVRCKLTIPQPHGAQAPAAPSGQAVNDLSSAFKGDTLIVATTGGTIAGWQHSFSTTAVIRVDSSAGAAAYTGVAVAKLDGAARLFAADFRNNRIDVFDDRYQPVADHRGFEDHKLPAGFAPFNVVARGDVLFVTYALHGEHTTAAVAGAGKGFVNVFDPSGRLLERLIAAGSLDAPWGLAFLDPPDCEAADESSAARVCWDGRQCREKYRLLVGNSGDGRINAFQIERSGLDMEASELGPLVDPAGQPIVIERLWGLGYGPGAGGFSDQDLFFTAGPGEGQHGVFGKLTFR